MDEHLPDERFTAPLSFAQQRLWLVTALDPNAPTYNLRSAYRLRGPLDHAALRASLAGIAERHEALRTTFEDGIDEPLQIIAARLDPELAIENRSGLDVQTQQHELKRILQAAGDRPFDLATGPLVRALLVQLGPADHVLLLVIHHIVFDGASVTPFNRELSARYNAVRRGVPANFDELPIQYADYAAWQLAARDDYDIARGLVFWRDTLAGAPPRIALGVAGPKHGGHRSGAIASIALSNERATQLRELGRSHGATIFVTLLAVFNVVLYRYSGQRDLVVGTPIANRSRTELEPLIGFFVNTLALRTRIDGTLRFDELLERTRATALAAFDQQHVPFERVVAALAPARAADETPLFNVMFFGRTNPAAELSFDGIDIARFQLESTRAKFDLSFRFAEEAHGLSCSLQYDTRRFDAAAIAGMLDDFAQLVTAIVTAPGTPIDALPMLARSKAPQPVAGAIVEPAGRNGAHDAPGGAAPIEREVAEIVATVLRCERVGPHDDFFALGGHSLLATRVIARLGDRFDVALSLRDFFADPTVAGLARRIAVAPSRARTPARAPIDANLANFSDAQIEALLEEARFE